MHRTQKNIMDNLYDKQNMNGPRSYQFNITSVKFITIKNLL